VPPTKQVTRIHTSPALHWVGDGFPVSSVFSPRSVGTHLSPFVLMDYAGPAAFEPTARRRGVGFHPHRGFETVTVVYQGELEHTDTAGNAGTVGPGDVQWMTAASGVLHEERHSRGFSRTGGTLEMAQLGVNLPARHKKDSPRYQDLRRDAIPQVKLPDAAGTARIIAGDWGRVRGPARTVTPVILWDVALREGARVRLPIPAGCSGGVFVRSGRIVIAGDRVAEARQLAVLARDGEHAGIEAEEGAELLIVGGEPIDEPVVAHGPFVMNTPEEITQAVEDVRAGRFGAP